MMADVPASSSLTPTRRSVAKGAAWAAPVVALGAPAALAAASGPDGCPAVKTTCLGPFSNNSSVTLPEGVTCYEFTIIGGGGAAQGGSGAQVKGTVTIPTGGSRRIRYVTGKGGGFGTSGGGAGFGKGGSAGIPSGAGGGGGSAIFSGTGTGTLVAAAGGGGGGGQVGVFQPFQFIPNGDGTFTFRPQAGQTIGGGNGSGGSGGATPGNGGSSSSQFGLSTEDRSGNGTVSTNGASGASGATPGTGGNGGAISSPDVATPIQTFFPGANGAGPSLTTGGNGGNGSFVPAGAPGERNGNAGPGGGGGGGYSGGGGGGSSLGRFGTDGNGNQAQPGSGGGAGSNYTAGVNIVPSTLTQTTGTNGGAFGAAGSAGSILICY